MEDGPLRCALFDEHAQDVVVRVPVMDLQHLAQPFGQRDVPPEAALLRGASRDVVGGHPMVVKTGLPHHPDPGVPGQLLDLGQRLVEHPLPLRGERGRLGGMQCDPPEDLRIPLDQVDGPPGRVELATDLDDAGHVDRSRRPERFLDVERLVPGPGVVEVGVVVDHRERQGLRRRRPAHRPRSPVIMHAATWRRSRPVWWRA